MASVPVYVTPFTVGVIAGPVVYHRSPLIVVPAIVLVYVLARTPNVVAAPRDGVDAAFTLNAQYMIVANTASIERIPIPRLLFLKKKFFMSNGKKI